MIIQCGGSKHVIMQKHSDLHNLQTDFQEYTTLKFNEGIIEFCEIIGIVDHEQMIFKEKTNKLKKIIARLHRQLGSKQNSSLFI